MRNINTLQNSAEQTAHNSKRMLQEHCASLGEVVVEEEEEEVVAGVAAQAALEAAPIREEDGENEATHIWVRHITIHTMKTVNHRTKRVKKPVKNIIWVQASFGSYYSAAVVVLHVI